MATNSAFVFIKPHAVTDATINLVREHFISKGFTVNSEGQIDAKEIEARKLVDQHYYAIASKATLLKPDQLNVPADKFEKQFGLSWKDALAQGKCYNAIDAAEKLGLNSTELESLWRETKKAKKMVKFGGGFYCGEIKPGMYAFNGFFMSMRSKFVIPGTSIHYYVVDWDENDLKWADFRGKALGPTDPAKAPKDSIRGMIMRDWKELGLDYQPTTGDNGVHASASPFEGLAEKMNWLKVNPSKDAFGAALINKGVDVATIKKWSVDPQVKGASLFDQLEDQDVGDCIKTAVELSK